MIDVKGRWALITGAARGIGRLSLEEAVDYAVKNLPNYLGSLD